MDEFRLLVTVEVDQVGNALNIQTPVPLELGYRAGRWQARCNTPAVSTPKVESLQEAIINGARQAAMEIQAAVIERPCIAGRITPADIPADMF